MVSHDFGTSSWSLRITCFSPAGDVRLYRETPAAVTSKGRGGKARGAKAKPPAAGTWELLADSLEALQEAGEKLRRNKQRPEQRLALQVPMHIAQGGMQRPLQILLRCCLDTIHCVRPSCRGSLLSHVFTCREGLP